MTRPLAPRPRRLRRRGRCFSQSEQELGEAIAAKVLALPNCSYRELGEQWWSVWGTEPPRKASREFLIQLTAKKLMRLALDIPVDWREQRKLLGVHAR